MKAEEARKITRAHSQRMQNIYGSIKSSASKGVSSLVVHTGEITSSEIEVLKELGYSVNYEISETDGGQFVSVTW